jgi:hypothetical protein
LLHDSHCRLGDSMMAIWARSRACFQDVPLDGVGLVAIELVALRNSKTHAWRGQRMRLWQGQTAAAWCDALGVGRVSTETQQMQQNNDKREQRCK